MRADEPSADLAVAMAVLSNLLDKVIPDDMLLLGEIGLAGEIRSTPQVQQRVGGRATDWASGVFFCRKAQ